MSDKNPSHELAVEIVHFLETKSELDASIILAALSMVLAAVAVEAGMEEEKAMYAFRKSYGQANNRLKKLMKAAQ